MALAQTFRDITKLAESFSKCVYRISWRKISDSTSTSCLYLTRPNGNRIAYRVTTGNNPGVVFVPGFLSHMRGTKGMALENYCLEKNLAYTRFDYQGCGLSDGLLADFTFTDWKSDLLAVIDQVTAGPQVLVGSSIGGWLSLLATMERSHRVQSLVGIATAADIDLNITDEIRVSLDKEGFVNVDSDDGIERVITRKFVDDCKNHHVLGMTSMPITCPVRLIHGMLDDVVPYNTSMKVAEKLWSTNVDVILRKAGKHRLSQPDDIEVLFEVLNQLIFGSKDVRELVLSSWLSYSIYNYPKVKRRDV